MSRSIEGVCCQCQSVHPVRLGREPEMDLIDGFEDFMEELGKYLMVSHDAWGEHCEGSGTMPQTLVALDSRAVHNGYNDLDMAEL